MAIYKDLCRLIGPEKTEPSWFYDLSNHPRLTHCEYKNVTCLPSDITKPANTVQYGLYSESLEPLTDFKHFRGKNSDVFSFIDHKQKHIKPIQELNGQSLYLGWVFPHYGHFITESLSRLWGMEVSKYDYFLLHFRKEKLGFISDASIIWDILARLGISKEKVILVDKPMMVEKLHIASQAMILRRSISTEMKHVWRAIAKNVKQPHRKIYLSRRGLKRRVLSNEKELEVALIKKGFEIIRPQDISFEEQLSIYAETRLLVSPAGSAVHNAVFMPKSSQVVSITNCDFIWVNELLCCYASGIDYVLYQAEGNINDNSWSIDIKDFLSYL